MKALPLLICTLLLGFFQSSYANQTAAPKTSKLINIVKTIKTQNKVKAIIFGVWINNKKVVTDALGDSMTGIPATTAMHFRIGGVTETFLTTLLMQLVDEHKLKLSDKLSKWFPKMPNANTVTVAMLARSSTGYPDYVTNKPFLKIATTDVFKPWKTNELLEYAFSTPNLYKPGTNQSYSHTDYAILGKLLEKITGKSISALLQHYIFNQLGLKNTAFSSAASIQPPVLHSFSSDRGIYEDASFWDPSWTSYSGSMTSNIDDLGRWANAFGAGKLLSPASYRELTAPATVGLGRNRPDMYFGMGFVVINHWLMQNPRFNGFSGVFAYLPSKKITIIVFNTLSPSNSSDVNYSMKVFRKLVKFLAPNNLIPERKN